MLLPAIADRIWTLAEKNPELLDAGVGLIEQILKSGHPDPNALIRDISEAVVASDLRQLAEKKYPLK